MSENRMLRKLFGTKRMKSQEGGENCTVRSSIIVTVQQILLG
jgi:hypothetical protein